jgi:hypothetical protein
VDIGNEVGEGNEERLIKMKPVKPVKKLKPFFT